MRKLLVTLVGLTVLAAGIGFVVTRGTPVVGSLVRTTSTSTVGVLLDEIPASMRPRVAEALVTKPQDFWTSRAATQLRLTTYRLVFRDAFYDTKKAQLPLPPEPKWDIKLSGAPKRQRIDGHDFVAVGYTFSSVLLSDVHSPGVSEPALASVGGVWREPFMFPIDPELVMQRTGFACMDEAEFPFGSVDSEEVDSFYDQDCDVEKSLSNVDQCHNTKRVTQSCVDAVKDHVGGVNTEVKYERLGWDRKLADAFRYGPVTGDAPDLKVYLPEFAPSRLTYRYVHASSCEMVEHSVGGTGWRRLLQFATSDENVGNRALTIGGVDYAITGKHGELDSHNLFEFNPCHKHYHFKYYGDFTWKGAGQVVNSKKGFCLQSTQRVANRETSPLHNPFAGCSYQGMEAGWVDQYKAGLSGQWLDTTNLPPGTGKRSFTSNPNGFLCEGAFLDAAGKPLGPEQPVVWAPTGLIADNGKPVEAPRCRLTSSWDANNHHAVDETISAPGEGLITTQCTRGQIGPLRNCGFRQAARIATCVPGRRTTATLSIPNGAAPQIVRITEFSHVLNSAIPARFEDSYVPVAPGVGDQPSLRANAIVTASTTVTFTCPGARRAGAYEPGGSYAIYSAPVFPDDPSAIVSSVPLG